MHICRHSIAASRTRSPADSGVRLTEEWWDIRDDGYGVFGFTLLGQRRILRVILLKDGP